MLQKLLSISLLFHITNGSIYNVTPDDNPAAINVLGTFSLVRVKRIKITILYKDKEHTSRSVVRSCKLNILQFELIYNILDDKHKIKKCEQKHPFLWASILSSTDILFDQSVYDLINA